MEKEYKNQEIGVLWEKQSASGIKYFSGVLNMVDTGKINIVIFKNNGKSEKAPTHIILKSKPKEIKQELPQEQDNQIEESLPF